jgi:hypothetical protein
LPEGADEHAAALVGLAPMPGVAAALGVEWWSDRPGRLHRAADRPLAWWPRLSVLRARAWAEYGQQPGEWERKAVGRWHSAEAMRRARADYERAGGGAS